MTKVIKKQLFIPYFILTTTFSCWHRPGHHVGINQNVALALLEILTRGS